MKIGQTLRIVQMNGCMATDRHNSREGTAVGFIARKTYGALTPVRYVRIAMDYGGKIEERPAEPRLWGKYHDGILEYQE